jgi:hypothetical protein
MKRDCISCRGTMSHRNGALKAVMCPAAYARKLERHQEWRARNWVNDEADRMAWNRLRVERGLDALA